MLIHWNVVEQYFTVVLFVFQFNPVCNFRKSLLDLAPSGVKGLKVTDLRQLTTDLLF